MGMVLLLRNSRLKPGIAESPMDRYRSSTEQHPVDGTGVVEVGRGSTALEAECNGVEKREQKGLRFYTIQQAMASKIANLCPFILSSYG